MSSSPLIPPQTWKRDETPDYVVSSEPALLSVEDVNAAYAMDFIYWGNPFPEEVLRQVLHGSLSFGVYKMKKRSTSTSTTTFHLHPDDVEQIGLARMVTDGATFAYLTDVYILPDHQGRGLGRWLIECVAETFSANKMPYLRRILLVTGDERMQEFYSKMFGMQVIGHEERRDMGKSLAFLCARPNAKSTSG